MDITARVVLFEPDLLFSSKIEATARRLAVDLKVVTDLAELQRELSDSHARVFMTSLDSLEGKLQVLENFLKTSSKVIGYYSHVKGHLAEDAKRAGVETVLSRGAFVGKMQDILREFSRTR